MLADILNIITINPTSELMSDLGCFFPFFPFFPIFAFFFSFPALGGILEIAHCLGYHLCLALPIYFSIAIREWILINSFLCFGRHPKTPLSQFLPIRFCSHFDKSVLLSIISQISWLRFFAVCLKALFDRTVKSQNYRATSLKIFV